LVKCVAAAFSNYCAGVPVEVVGEEVSDAFCLVHIFDLVFWFRRRRGGSDLDIQSHNLDFPSTTFFQENENNFGGLRSRLKPSSAGFTILFGWSFFLRLSFCT